MAIIADVIRCLDAPKPDRSKVGNSPFAPGPSTSDVIELVPRELVPSKRDNVAVNAPKRSDEADSERDSSGRENESVTGLPVRPGLSTRVPSANWLP